MTDSSPADCQPDNSPFATEDLVEQYFDAWQADHRPDLSEFIKHAETTELVLSLLIVDIRERRQRGLPIDLESYLSQYRAVGDNPEMTLDLIYSDYLVREELHEFPTVGEYAARFPAYADALTNQVTFHRQVSNVARCLQPESAESATWSTFVPGALVGGIPGYRILGLVGRGGSSVVLKARQQRLERQVALKVLVKSSADEELRHRFINEALAAAQIEHPNVVAIYDVGEHRGFPYLALEYVPGGTLFDELHGVPWPNEASARMILLLARGLQAAHDRGVIHRDLKPSNILLRKPFHVESTPFLDDADAASGVKIADFGLAKIVPQSGAMEWTLTGDVLGTPSYMAPEQALGRRDEIGPTTDIYSLGVILYELLVGRPPFRGRTPLDTLAFATSAAPVPPSRLVRGVSRDLETICLKCLEKSPEKRYATARQLAGDLERYFDGRPIAARPPSRLEIVRRWCARNPVVATLTIGLLLALTGGLFGALWQWKQAELARHGESVARQEAEQRALEVIDGLTRLQRANGFLERGYSFLPARRWDDAEDAFSRAIQLRPDYSTAWEARGEQLYVQLGLWDLAAADLWQAFQLKRPSLPDRWRWTALLLAHTGESEKYRQVCEALREQDSKGGLALKETLVRALALLADRESPSNELLGHADAFVAANRQDDSLAYAQAVARLRAGQYEQAIEACHRSLAMPEHRLRPELNYPVLALAHHGLGQASQAATSLRLAVMARDKWLEERRQRPAEPWVVSLGAASLQTAVIWDWLECEIYIREAEAALQVALPQSDSGLHLLRGRSFAGLRHPDKADEEYTIALGLAPDDDEIRFETHRNRGYLWVKRGEYARAADEFEKASGIRTDDCRLLEFQAFARVAAGDFAAYRRLCLEAIDRFGDTSDRSIAHCIVDMCTLREDVPADKHKLRRLGEIGSNWYAGGIRALGAVHFRDGEFDAAIDCFNQAFALGSRRPSDLVFLAMAHQSSGNAEEARTHLKRALEWVEQANQPDLNDPNYTEPAWGGWHERITLGTLIDEAEAVINIGA